MHKMMVALLALASVAAVYAQDVPEVRYYTNALELAAQSVETGRMRFSVRQIDPAQLPAVDDILVSGTNVVRVGAANFLPKATRRWLEHISGIAPNYAWIEMTCWFGDRDAVKTNTYAAVNCADFLRLSPISNGWVVNYKKKLLRIASVSVKRQLRSEGVSFVVKGDSNPVQERIDRLSSCLDAPRMEGVKEALAACGLTLDVHVSEFIPDAAEVAKLEDDVYNGAVEFNARRKGILLVALGVDGYNAFVKRYNGE